MNTHTNLDRKTAHTLNDLLAITRDGQAFYEEAAQKVDDTELRALFTRIGAVKAQLATELSGAVAAAGGTPDTDGTMRGNMQKMYGTVRAKLGDKEYSYVAELEESEDRLLEAFDDAIKDDDTPMEARTVLTRLMPDVRQCHDTMRARKLAMKKAA
ncbi:MAG: PA2169 family four-helix-bundle protein [Pseudomonadota bacterium]|nr:PA2169 family four-helix-bundle protein [Pseudomonadota bacterium]